MNMFEQFIEEGAREQEKKKEEVLQHNCGSWAWSFDAATKSHAAYPIFCNNYLECEDCAKRKLREFVDRMIVAKYFILISKKERRNLVRRLGGRDNYFCIPQGDEYLIFHNDDSQITEDTVDHVEFIWDFDSPEEGLAWLQSILKKWVYSSGRISGNLGKEIEEEDEEEDLDTIKIKKPVFYRNDRWGEIVDAAYHNTRHLLPDEDSLQRCVDILASEIKRQHYERGLVPKVNRWQYQSISIGEIDWDIGRDSYRSSLNDYSSEYGDMLLSDDGDGIRLDELSENYAIALTYDSFFDH